MERAEQLASGATVLEAGRPSQAQADKVYAWGNPVGGRRKKAAYMTTRDGDDRVHRRRCITNP